MPDVVEARLMALPAALSGPVRRQLQDFWAAAGAGGLALALDARVWESLPGVWAASEFVAGSCVRRPSLLQDLAESGDLVASYPDGYYAARLGARYEGIADEATLAAVVRRFREREMLRIAWRDIAGWADLNETLADLSALADACVAQTVARVQVWAEARWGVPRDSEGRPQSLLVVAMGKLGAGELNFSSDIDLIFAYPEAGEVQHGSRSISHDEYFARVGRSLIKALDEVTADGFVFRVDMRLRPFGESGPLVASFDALEGYYQSHGREWERYAMVKARVIAGDPAAGDRLMATLRPFVYRRYLDYGSFQSLREMKNSINAEVVRKGLVDNVKLGPGGIREVEFVGQAFQLIRGGRQPVFQERRILPVLALLGEHNYLPVFVVQELTHAYVFLRNTEHRLQEWADQQTQRLPGDELGRLRLACSMGYPDWTAFETELRRHMRRVHSHFEQVFAAPQAEAGAADEGGLDGVWAGTLAESRALEVLTAVGYVEPRAAWDSCRILRDSSAYRSLGEHGRERLDRLMPLLLGAVGATAEPLVVLPRLLSLVEAIARRSAYLALLVENPMALSQLVTLCAASPWISAYVERHPLLLDELLDPRTLYRPPDRAALHADLRQRLARIAPDDLEQQMDVLRHFKQSNVLRVAAADIAEAVPLMRVSDHLTDIAEVVLDEALEMAWHHLVTRHGRPLCTDAMVCDKGFAVLAYGKLGGLELGYGSDLDVVFLHASDDENRMTDGPKPLVNGVFFARLGQRIVHLLTAHTPAGVLYDVDTRLRPSGASGLLVSGIQSFAHYQATEAWTWEHQALVRARVVAGDPGIAARFGEIRREVLGRARDPMQLRDEVRTMRERMRAELGKAAPGRFHLKQGPGGIADIEFMVQYGVLAWAHQHPGLLQYTDNIRILAGFAERGLMADHDVATLSDAFRAYRARVHRLTLQALSASDVADDEFTEQRAAVVAIWRRLMVADG